MAEDPGAVQAQPERQSPESRAAERKRRRAEERRAQREGTWRKRVTTREDVQVILAEYHRTYVEPLLYWRDWCLLPWWRRAWIVTSGWVRESAARLRRWIVARAGSLKIPWRRKNDAVESVPGEGQVGGEEAEEGRLEGAEGPGR